MDGFEDGFGEERCEELVDGGRCFFLETRSGVEGSLYEIWEGLIDQNNTVNYLPEIETVA